MNFPKCAPDLLLRRKKPMFVLPYVLLNFVKDLLKGEEKYS